MQGSADDAILVLDDQEERSRTVSKFLSKEGYKVSTARSWQEAVEGCGNSGFPGVVTDFRSPKVLEIEEVRKFKKASPDTRVVLVTDKDMLTHAVQAMREGSIDGLLGCFSLERLEHSVKKVIELIPRRNNTARRIITQSIEMKKILDVTEKIAKSSTTVLIQGETGTGKEILARHIHNESPRKMRPFIAVNCAALPDTLMESELFGHEKGSFTGAMERKLGKFEIAQGGTLLLDEVGELNPIAQAKLLRVLQEREVDRVGGKDPIPVDVRVIATTNRNLKQEAIKGKFREDLYYRLNVLNITMPPLRERKEDIPLLLGHFIEKHCRKNGMETKSIDKKAEEILMKLDWKGNIRELENVIEKAVLLADGDTLTPDLFVSLDDEAQPDGVDVEGSFKDLEKKLIYRALEETGGNKTHAARKLGLSARTIRNKLKCYANSSQ